MSQPPPIPPLVSLPSLSNLSASINTANSLSSLQRHFSVTTLRSLSRRQSYVVVLDFSSLVLRWHKLRKGCEVKRTFAFQSAIKLEKHSKDPLCLTIMFAEAGHAVPVHSDAQSAPTTPTAASTSASSNVWQKVVFFASSDERELFCNLVHAAIVSGEKAVRLYQQLSQHPPPSPSSSLAPPTAVLSPALQSLVGVDFCSFLIAYCAAQNHLDHTAIALANQQSSSSPSSSPPSINTTQLDPPSRLPSHSRHGRRTSESSIALTDHLLAVSVGGSGSSCSGQQPSMQLMFGFRLLDGELVTLQAAHTTRLDVSGSSVGANVGDGRESGGGGSLNVSRPTSPSHSGAAGGGSGASASSRGNLFLTNYRVIYRDYHSTSAAAAASATSPPLPSTFTAFPASVSFDTEVPLACINRVIRPSPSLCSITVLTKDNRRVEFGFDASSEWVDGLVRRLIEAAFGGVKGMFAFEHGRARGRKMKERKERRERGDEIVEETGEEGAAEEDGEEEVDGWSLYSPVREYARLGLLSSSSFRLTTHNSSFSLCRSYPPSFVVPSIMSDADLLSVASHRSQQRLPATVYLHPLTSASLTRSSQPLSGVRGRRNELDEAMLAVLRKGNKTNSSQFVIVDARPYKAAMGNAVMGKGYENVAHYTGAKIEFCNIDNIHQVRGAMERLNTLCSPAASATSVASSTTSTSGGGSSEGDEDNWLSDLGRTQWLHWIRLLLAASVRVATLLSVDAVSVLVHCRSLHTTTRSTMLPRTALSVSAAPSRRLFHPCCAVPPRVCAVLLCSDGWDRTAQLTSLTLLLLDGYHRTMLGFAVLVEKEWLSFGHRFAERHGQGSGEYDNTQRAPIFLQWLDCVWQVMRQHPTLFEFNELWLLDAYDAMLSGRFGTFLFDCQREREEARLKSNTESVWSWMLSGKQRARYVNPLYQSPLTGVASASSSMSSSSTAAHHSDLIDALVSSSAAPAPTAQSASTLSYCIPNVSAKRILLWERCHLRWDRHAPLASLSPPWTAEQQLSAAAALVVGKERRIVRKYHTMRSRLEEAGVDLAALDLSDASDDERALSGWSDNKSTAAEATGRPSTADNGGQGKSRLSRTGGGVTARVAAKRAAAVTVSPRAFSRAKASGQLADVTVLTGHSNSERSVAGEEAKWAEQSHSNGNETDAGAS